MKIRNLIMVFGLGVLGFISCTKEEIVSLDSIDSEIEVRAEDNGPEICCDFDWVVQSVDDDEICCTYQILVNNYGDCQIQIVGLPNGFVAPQTSQIFEVSVCAKVGITYNVYSNANQTSTLCGSIYLAADCSTETPCNDCVFSFELEDLGKDIEVASLLQIGENCEDVELNHHLNGLVLVYNNDSNCSDIEAIDLYNAYFPNNSYSLTSLASYTSMVEDVIQEVAGCSGAQVSIVENGQGGLEYEFTYDCETCELILITASGFGFDLNDDCTQIEFPNSVTSAGGITNCGACE